eukprot:TRINITY_DN2679_c0_g1_i1.p3 TRINITY_DN2679_c0_g1~~TRINITY_DN2679_c0_g1_i1.p3  ORF type:complete len:100 (+),score=33.78 TRINITY_DN2679_c0_g1_i1:773-1072(+)
MTAVKVDERTKKETWFNSLVLLHPASYENKNQMGKWNVTWEDGSEIADEDVHTVKKIMDEESMRFKWKRGDVVLIDNFLALHSRAAFTPPRRILAAMAN